KMMGRKDRSLLIRAWRVLSQTGEGVVPSRRDVIILRRSARAEEADLPINDLCSLLIQRESAREAGADSMTQAEMRSLQELAGRALYLARLRDQRRITETEYVDRLNDLRRQQGLGAVHPHGSS